MFMPSASDGVHDMWWPAPWDAEEQAEQCFERFGLRPRPTWVSTYYGGRKALAAASNIAFSNGLLECVVCDCLSVGRLIVCFAHGDANNRPSKQTHSPWSGTGVLGDINERYICM
jgi:hypothetical protein